MSYFTQKSDCAHHRIFPGVDIFTTCGQEMMLSLVEMEPHAVVEPHSHPHPTGPVEHAHPHTPDIHHDHGHG